MNVIAFSSSTIFLLYHTSIISLYQIYFFDGVAHPTISLTFLTDSPIRFSRLIISSNFKSSEAKPVHTFLVFSSLFIGFMFCSIWTRLRSLRFLLSSGGGLMGGVGGDITSNSFFYFFFAFQDLIEPCHLLLLELFLVYHEVIIFFLS